MNSRLIRVLLLVVAIGIGIAASYLLKTIEGRLTGERAAADLLRNRAVTLSATIADIRAAQIAYVARGQGEAFWMGRVSKLLPVFDQQLADFRAALMSPAAQADVEPAAAALDNFQKLDARARDYVRSDDPLQASDLIFSDGLEATATAATQIDTALRNDLQVREAGIGALRRQELTILAGGATSVLLILIALGLTGAKRAADPESVAPSDATIEDATPEPAPLSAPSPSLKIAAQVCTDLARVFESRQLPALMERAARVIDASGIIVWMAEGAELRPVMSFGYSDQVMARMGSISSDATNAVAAAFRSAEIRTVAGDGLTKGALLAPLITADGCVGVFSAELKGGAERDERSQSLASIFAAQLATLVSPPASAALAKTAAQA